MDCDLEKRYQKYLKDVDLDEDQMPISQRNIMRLTFMGACDALLNMMKYEMPALTHEEALEKMGDMHNQTKNFFLKKSNRLN